MSKPTDEQISYERNFHIHNDDRFLMEKITVTKIVHQGDDTQDLINFAREEAELNFKTRYPHIHDYLNFCEPKQVNGNSKGEARIAGIDWSSQNMESNVPYASQPNPPIPVIIGKGTIEDQIKACKTEKELKEWRILSDSTPKLKPIYEKKLAELQKQSVR